MSKRDCVDVDYVLSSQHYKDVQAEMLKAGYSAVSKDVDMAKQAEPMGLSKNLDQYSITFDVRGTSSQRQHHLARGCGNSILDYAPRAPSAGGNTNLSSVRQ